ncbi:MAG: sugar phosphate isomerase/epimerase [Acidobacteria bacterium]|nr:sugar phosphate isomerase/epimerase [Acidobacteriota bacterium]
MNTPTHRRAFLRAAGASLAAAGLAPSAPAANTGGGPKIGIATYSLRKFTRPQAIEMIRRLKVDYVSIKEFHMPLEDSLAQVAAAAREFRDAGITVLSGGNIGLDEPGSLRARFEYARAAGLPMMVCAPSHETLPEVEKLVKEFNIKAALHNHGPEDKHFPSPESVLTAVKNMDRRVGLCMDIGHTARTGADSVEWIRAAGPRLLDMHVKDLKEKLTSRSQCAIGEGVLPLPAIVKQLRKINYQGGMMLEYEIEANDPMVGMAKSIAYLRGLEAGLDNA